MTRSAPGDVNQGDVEAFERDGAVCLRGVFDRGWIERMCGAVDRLKSEPGPMRQKFRPDDPGEFFSDKFMWTHDPDFRDYVMRSPAAALAARLMGSAKINVFFDQLLVKEPRTLAPSPWHQDLNFWPFTGRQVCTVWMPLDLADRESGVLEFVRGSHLWKERPFSRELVFANDDKQPQDVAGDNIPETDDPQTLPDIEADRDAYDIISWDLEPGDALAFTALTLHAAPGNASNRRRRALATRWTGDDIRYALKRKLATLLRDPGLVPGDTMDCDLFPVVWRAAQDT